MTAMMEDTPHVRAHAAKIEDIVQGFVDLRPRRDGVVIAIMSDVQQKERLREAAQKVEADKLPGAGPERIQSNPCAHEDGQTEGGFFPPLVGASVWGVNIFAIT